MTIRLLQLSLSERGTIFGKVTIEDVDGANPTVTIHDGRGENIMDAISADEAERALSDEESKRLVALVRAFRDRSPFPSVFEAETAQFGDGLGRYDVNVQMKVRPPQHFRFRNFAIKPGDDELDPDIAALTRALVKIAGFEEPRAVAEDVADGDAASTNPLAGKNFDSLFDDKMDQLERSRQKNSAKDDSDE